MTERDLERAALRGEPSYVWRAGQERRLRMILAGADGRESGVILDDGCGVGEYMTRFAEHTPHIYGLEFEPDHVSSAAKLGHKVTQGASEHLPFSDDAFDLILSHEVLEHVEDDRAALEEIVRVLRIPGSDSSGGGRLVLFVPNRGYPFETHGIYLRGRYRFGNIPLVNYLPRRFRDRLAPHVRVYTRGDLKRLFRGLPIKIVHTTRIFGAYDNIIARWPSAGKLLRTLLQSLEATPLRVFGLSHFCVIERIE
ncbi:MAG: class I SAM-dependent methyltransferase [Anaerolineales bacterium]